MSKRRNESDASAPFEGLIKSLKSADNDGNRLEEIVSKRDSASTADVLAVPLSGARFPSVNESKLKMLPQETLCDILANLCRRDFDVLELINRALVSLISAKFNDALRRVISLMFYEEGLVMATCPSDGWRRLPIVELPRYLPRSVITKVNIKSGSDHALNEEMYQGENQWVGKRECDQALRPCRAHFAADAVCEFRWLSVFPPEMFYRALTEVFIFNTVVLAKLDSFFDHRHYTDEQSLPALPCLANCANLQLDEYHSEFFDANGALEWLLGTHAATDSVKHLSIGEIGIDSWNDFLRPFIAAIEQQFLQATSPTSFNVELILFVGHSPAPDLGMTRELKNTDTNERLKVNVDTNVRKPSGEPALKTKVIIQRKPLA
ncbi:hypothetical protein AAVH_19687 [Aphelenchoides avenae]|nr:hypothetical protein AAVH_19687 [Aphelenchus avenae]